MCNCGNKRNDLPAALSGNRAQNDSEPPARKMWPDVNFMYTGQTALSVTGNITGRRYRFSAPGEQQLVDYRDASFMATVPVLKKLA